MKDKNRLGSLFSTPPEDLDNAVERLSFMDQKNSTEEIREATQMTPKDQDDAVDKLKLMGTHPTNIIDFKFNDIEEFCLALKSYYWDVKATRISDIPKDCARQIWVVRALYKHVAMKFVLLEHKRPQYVTVFQALACSYRNHEWSRECYDSTL